MLHYNEYGLDTLGKGFTCSARVYPKRILQNNGTIAAAIHKLKMSQKSRDAYDTKL
jgi:hypothetical protein